MPRLQQDEEQRIDCDQLQACETEPSAKAPLASLLELPRETVGEPLALLLFAQLVLFVGVGAVIPTIALYGKAIGLSSTLNGVVLSAPAVMLALLARPAGGFADVARKPGGPRAPRGAGADLFGTGLSWRVCALAAQPCCVGREWGGVR